jgi:hypothetical protein
MLKRGGLFRARQPDFYVVFCRAKLFTVKIVSRAMQIVLKKYQNLR